VKKRVLVISQLPPPFHGSTVMTEVFLEALDALDFSYRLVDRRFSRSLDSVGRFSFFKIFGAVGLALRLVVAIVAFRPEQAVFFMTNRTASFLVDVVLSQILWLFRIPTIGYIHTQGFTAISTRGKLWSLLTRLMLGSARTLVCLSPALESDVRDLAPNAKVVSIGNTPLEIQGLPSVENAITPTVVFLSNLIPEKGIREFLDLGQAFGDAGSDARFIAVGAPTSANQLSELRDLAGANTEVLDPIHGEEKWRLLSSATVLVFPSRYQFEAQPLVIVEAMSVGVPVIAYAIGGIADLIIDGQTGYLIAEGDFEGLRIALQSLLSSPETAARMTTAARHNFDAKYSRASYERSWNDILSRR
jgi:glycosyltransferase involved in cell wall biosynthesis